MDQPRRLTLEVPLAHVSTRRNSRQSLAIESECDINWLRDLAGNIRQKRHHPAAAGDVPQADSSVQAARRQLRAIRAERQSFDLARMPRKREPLLSIGRIPEPGQAVVTGRGDKPSVRAERDRVDRVAVTTKRELLLARQRVPQPGGPVPTGSCYLAAIGTESHRQHFASVSDQRQLCSEQG